MKKLFCACIALCMTLSTTAWAETFKCIPSENTEAMYPGGLDMEENTSVSAFSLRSMSATETELTLEEYLRQEMKNHTQSIDVSAYRITPAELDDMYNTFIFCNSDLPILTGCGETVSGGYVMTISPYYVYETKEESDEKYAALNALTDELAEYADKGKTELEKALLLYDKIVIDYDYTPGEEEDFTRKHRTAYSFLDDDVAVCQGYAILYKSVLDKLGIENYLCTNENTDVNHAWSYIKLDGNWYHSDTTYGEFSDDRTAVNHKYFIMNDSEMAGVEHHGVKADWEIQSPDMDTVDCESDKYSCGYLFHHFNSPFDRDEKSLIFTNAFITTASSELTLTFRCSSLTAPQMLISEEKESEVYIFSLEDAGAFKIFIAAYKPDGSYRTGLAGSLPSLAANSIVRLSVPGTTPSGSVAGDSLKYMLLGIDYITPLGNYTTVN